jgi:hypothetical protein
MARAVTPRAPRALTSPFGLRVASLCARLLMQLCSRGPRKQDNIFKKKVDICFFLTPWSATGLPHRPAHRATHARRRAAAPPSRRPPPPPPRLATAPPRRRAAEPDRRRAAEPSRRRAAAPPSRRVAPRHAEPPRRAASRCSAAEPPRRAAEPSRRAAPPSRASEPRRHRARRNRTRVTQQAPLHTAHATPTSAATAAAAAAVAAAAVAKIVDASRSHAHARACGGRKKLVRPLAVSRCCGRRSPVQIPTPNISF